MVVKHQINDSSEISINYREWLGDWIDEQLIEELVESKYMSHLIHYIWQTYNSSDFVYPKNRKDIFHCFRSTPFHTTKVVILGDEPSNHIMSNGIGPGLYHSDHTRTFSKQIEDLEEAVTKNYESKFEWDKNLQTWKAKFDKKFDKSLTSWSNQGILFLNTSLINNHMDKEKEATKIIFRNLIRTVLKTISDNLAGIIFVFTDEEQYKALNKYIDLTYHYIIKDFNGIDKDTNIFEEINQVLIDNDSDVEVLTEDVIINW